MLNIQQFADYTATIGINDINSLDEKYHEYSRYEFFWVIYFKNIFIPNYNKKSVRIIFLESCPGGQDFVHPNYIFYNMEVNDFLDSTNDKYLIQIAKGFNNNFNKLINSKRKTLIQLAKQNVLLLDILPSHGFSLNEDNRRNVNNNIRTTSDLDKINNYTIKQFVDRNITDIRYCFATPPVIDYNQIATHINHGVNYGTMTASSGYPSYNLLSQLIKEGF